MGSAQVVNQPAQVRVGVVGVGSVGSAHARDLLAGNVGRCALTAVADVAPAALEGVSGVARFRDASSLIRSGLVDAVVIATPHPDHPVSAIAALQAGLHVLVEKPLASHKADCERMLAAFETRPRREQVFAEMFNQRTDPRFLKLRELISQGELGNIERISWTATDWFRTDTYYRIGGWRATWEGEGGGVLLNQAPHQLDLLVWLFGMPRRVRAFCGFGAYHRIEVEDRVTAYLEFPNGCSGVFTTTTGEAPGENRLVIAADRGRVVVEPNHMFFTLNLVSAREFQKTSPERFASPPTRELDLSVPTQSTQHREVLANFVAAILDGAPLIAPAVEGIASVELANAMIYSAVRDETVDIPLDSKAYAALLGELIAKARSRGAP
jgi:predicted dehydrogenase